MTNIVKYGHIMCCGKLINALEENWGDIEVSEGKFRGRGGGRMNNLWKGIAIAAIWGRAARYVAVTSPDAAEILSGGAMILILVVAILQLNFG